MRFIPILFIFALVAVFITTVPVIFGSFETEHNVTVSNHTAEYNALTALTQTDLVVIGIIGMLLVVALLLILARVFM